MSATFEDVDIIVCPTCGGGTTCSDCGGSGYWTPDTNREPVACYACKGSGVCITCAGSGKYTRRRRIREPLVATQRGSRLCPACDGSKYCGACLGTGRWQNGIFCKVCDMHSGICSECNGDGEVAIGEDD